MSDGAANGLENGKESVKFSLCDQLYSKLLLLNSIE